MCVFHVSKEYAQKALKNAFRQRLQITKFVGKEDNTQKFLPAYRTTTTKKATKEDLETSKKYGVRNQAELTVSFPPLLRHYQRINVLTFKFGIRLLKFF
jgi:hypothetical protein